MKNLLNSNQKIKYLLIVLLMFVISLLVLTKYSFNPSNNIEVCDKMSSNELKVMCYSMFLKQYKYCSLVGTSSSICVDFVSSSLDLNESLCMGLEDYQKSSCIFSLAIKNKDPNICNLLGGNDTISSCYFSLSPYLDELPLNEEFCNKISEESLRFVCLTKLTRDASLCENIKQEPFEKANCLAVASKNIGYCQNATNSDYCLLLVALDNNDSALCEKISTEVSKVDCLLQIKKDISYCDNFEGTWKDYCILNFFKLKNLNII